MFPTAAVLQVAYTEALALLLVASALLLLLRRDYGWMALVVVALGFTRAVALPMAASWWCTPPCAGGRRAAATDTWTWRTGAGLARAGAARRGLRLRCGPRSAGGSRACRTRYLQTQEAWRGVREVAPFGGWFYVPAVLVRVPGAPGGAGRPVALVVAVLVVPAAWRLGNELHAWAAAYIVYIAAVVEPGSSLARFLLLAFPLGAVTAGVVTRPAAARRWWFGAVVRR